MRLALALHPVHASLVDLVDRELIHYAVHLVLLLIFVLFTDCFDSLHPSFAALIELSHLGHLVPLEAPRHPLPDSFQIGDFLLPHLLVSAVYGAIDLVKVRDRPQHLIVFAAPYLLETTRNVALQIFLRAFSRARFLGRRCMEDLGSVASDCGLLLLQKGLAHELAPLIGAIFIEQGGRTV